MAQEGGFVVPFQEQEYEAPLISSPPPDDDVDHRTEQDRQMLLDHFASNSIENDKTHNLQDFFNLLKTANVISDQSYLQRVLFPTDCNAITARKFVEEFLSHRHGKQRALDAAQRELQSIEKLLQASEASLTKETAREALIPSGAPEESKLTVQIVSVQNFQQDMGEGTPFKVQLECQNQAIETKTQIVRQGVVFWNEMFSFQIESKEGDLHITLIKVDFQETPRGDASIMIEDFSDQKKHEMTREIWGATNCEILISAQWVYSRKVLHQNYIREFTAKRERKLQEISSLSAEMDSLQKSLSIAPSGPSGFSSTIGGFLEGPETISRAVDRVMDNLKLTNYQSASQYVVAIAFLLSAIACCARPVFLDLINMGFAFWCNIDSRRWTTRRYGVLLGLLIFSGVLDFVWIVTYFTAWNNSTVEADMQNVTKIFSLLNFLWKIVLLLFFWKCYYDLRKKISHRGMAATRQRPPTTTIRM